MDKEIAALREALQWYADKKNYITDVHGAVENIPAGLMGEKAYSMPMQVYNYDIIADSGERARKALQEPYEYRDKSDANK